MPGIFISYRRTDTLPWAGRLFDDLKRSFGKQLVFMDINGGIPRGADFEHVLNDALTGCDAVLALIGPTWLTCMRSDGTPRLTAPGDWVRNEIATGLRRGVPVVPVLFGGAKLPDEQSLPEELRALSKRQNADVADMDWHHHVGLLIRDLERLTTLKALQLPGGDDVESVSSGIRLLSRLVEQNPDVATAVGRSKEVFENTYRQVGRLELFKSIHDALHMIEMECLRPLQVATTTSVRPFKFAFTRASRHIRKALESDSLNPALRDDIADALTDAEMAFQSAVDKPEKETTERLVGALNALISGPPARLDVAISDAARDLSLDRLVELMDSVRSTLGSDAADDTLRGFLQGVEALGRLRNELAQRTGEHGRLQALDSKLRSICLGGIPAGDLAAEWVRVKRIRARLGGPGASLEFEAADGELNELERAVEAALAEANPRAGFELVQDYFRAVGSVFRDVDSALKDFCMQLTGVSQALKAILDVMQA